MLQRIVILIALMIFMGTDLPASEIQFMTHSLKGQVYSDENGELRGKKHGGRRAFNVELVRHMMIIVGHSGRFIEVPFKRGFRMVQNEKDYALFNVNRTPEREDTVKWVGPLQGSVTHLYELKEAPTGIQTFDDARGVNSICVLNGNVHHRLLERKGFNNLSPNKSYNACARMLLKRRVDLTPLSNLSSFIKDPEFSQSIQRTPVKLSEAKGYIVFSMDVPDHVIQKWQKAFDNLKRSGKYEQLVQQYLHSE